MNRTCLSLASLLFMSLSSSIHMGATATPLVVSNQGAVPPEGWIWQHLPYAAQVEERFRPITDTQLSNIVSLEMPQIVIDDEHAEVTLTDDVVLLMRVATVLQMLESRGVTNPFIAASQRAIAFYCHRLGIAHDTQSITRDTFERLPGAVQPESRQIAVAISESVRRIRGFSARWFPRTLTAGSVEAVDFNRLGLFERAEGRLGASWEAFAKGIAIGPTEPMMLNAYRTLLEMGSADGDKAAAELREKALASSPRLLSRFDYHLDDVSERLGNDRWLAERPELDAPAMARRIVALTRQGLETEAEALIRQALGRFRDEPGIWRVAAGFYQIHQRRESLRVLMAEANELGMLRDDGLREFRLVAMLDARNMAISGGPANINDIEMFDTELRWLEGRGEDYALMAAGARFIVVIARHFAGNEKGADTAAEAAAAIEGLLSRFGHLEKAWRLAIGGYAALRSLETEGPALRKRLGRVRGDWKPAIDAYLARIEGAYAMRARDVGAIAKASKSLEKIAKSRRAGPVADSEKLVRGGLQILATTLDPKAATKPVPESARLQLQQVVDTADLATGDGRRAAQAALAGLAGLDTMAGRTEAARERWSRVRAIGEHPFLTAIGAAWSLFLGGFEVAAIEFFARAAEHAGTPHGIDYALRAEARVWRKLGNEAEAVQRETKADRAAADDGMSLVEVPSTGFRAVFASNMQLALTVAWDEKLALNVVIDPVVVVLPLP